jgi:hypothetical protein
MKILFRAYLHQKKFQKKVGKKFIRVRIRIQNQIRPKIVLIRNTGYSGKQVDLRRHIPLPLNYLSFGAI